MIARLFAGMDAGGTSTRCVVTDDRGALIGAGQSGPGNPLLNGIDAALASYAEALNRALRDHPRGYLAHLHITAAGAGVPEGIHTLAPAYSTSHDTAGAFAGALVQGPGVIVIGGTGSVSYGEDEAGHGTVVGGWGPLLGDEGSGYAIGRAALQRLGWAIDRRIPGSSLTTMLIEHLGSAEPYALQRRLYEPPVSRDWIAALTTIVADAAHSGDRHARALLRQAGVDLGQTAAAIVRILQLQHTAVRVSTAGGVFSVGALVLDSFTQQLRRTAPAAQLVPARYPPVIGALLLAYRAEKCPIDETLLDVLDNTSAHFSSALNL